jgi:hypothetical protein
LALAAGEVGAPPSTSTGSSPANAALAAWLGQQPLPADEPEEALVYFGWSGLGTPTPPPTTPRTSWRSHRRPW